MKHIKRDFRSKAWVSTPGWTWGCRKVKIQLFQNMVMLHITNHECNNMVANILPSDPLTLGWGQNSTFSEHGHVGYQTKGNHKCSNMVSNILPPDTPTPMGVKKVKIQLFQNMVMLHIKSKGFTDPPPPPPPLQIDWTHLVLARVGIHYLNPWPHK